ncbi:uncharacterized protein KY384_005142 [Bacidia gigantensis]|uniref:uncharacterized protein n=1 Tax=Bacidia gigantensis TaxID=2732470 RepID=UPI001D044988|nr:uncharacterized protein KY384_005142 [Bacidia gigantensis]KAG8529661.1 hypothetical protein KY384_005142 [Bacidia gigantensis]
MKIVTMSPHFSINDIHFLAKDIHDLHDPIAAHVTFFERLVLTLNSSSQKFDSWVSTWLGDQIKYSSQLKALWGSDAWGNIQRLLENIKLTSLHFKTSNPSIQPKVYSKLWRERRSSSKQKTKSGQDYPSQMLETALELEKRIDQLCAYTHLISPSLYQDFTRNEQDTSPSRSEEPRANRKAAVSLYHAAQRSGTCCTLCVDVPPKSVQPDNTSGSEAPSPGSTPSTQMPCYRLLVAADKVNSRTEEICLEHVLTFDNDLTSPTPHKANLAALMYAASGSHVRLQAQALDSLTSETVFKVLRKDVVDSEHFHRENLDRYFFDEAEIKPPTRSERYELAFSFAQSCFFLLGTPWLANLDSRQLQRLRRNGRAAALGWTNEILPLERVSRIDQSALSMSSQLMRIGFILIEIAMGDLEGEDFANLENPLTLATLVAGIEYSRACEFCINGRLAAHHFWPEVKNCVKEPIWNTDIGNLLNEFDKEVLSR